MNINDSSIPLKDESDFCQKNPGRACPQCPYSRACAPGALGGSPVEVYVGQITGPFWLPCHLHSDFDDPGWKTAIEKPQCAGAAIFRANLGIDGEQLPAALHRLPAGSDANVFATLEEFVAHHLEINLAEARIWLGAHPPFLLMKLEMVKAALIQERGERQTQYAVRNTGNTTW